MTVNSCLTQQSKVSMMSFFSELGENRGKFHIYNLYILSTSKVGNTQY